MSETKSLYLIRFRRYVKKCVFNLDGDLDLDLDPIPLKNKLVLTFLCRYLWYKFGAIPIETLDARVLTDIQTEKQTNEMPRASRIARQLGQIISDKSMALIKTFNLIYYSIWFMKKTF